MYMMRKNEMRMNETVQNGTRRKREGINRTGHNEAKIIPDKAERDGKKGMGQYETGKNRTRRNGREIGQGGTRWEIERDRRMGLDGMDMTERTG
ncbi:unnamed protein product [Microthlaspi erraticum]|uniref:Uncharacterized protein n=1 Tax=Microthlaspi erraticum TaxID=1685480 RepID=A0A6D2J3Z6_9BRAS|nr:unnamed protein product [Microthlaspi erraticum]